VRVDGLRIDGRKVVETKDLLNVSLSLNAGRDVERCESFFVKTPTGGFFCRRVRASRCSRMAGSRYGDFFATNLPDRHGQLVAWDTGLRFLEPPPDPGVFSSRSFPETSPKIVCHWMGSIIVAVLWVCFAPALRFSASSKRSSNHTGGASCCVRRSFAIDRWTGRRVWDSPGGESLS